MRSRTAAADGLELSSSKPPTRGSHYRKDNWEDTKQLLEVGAYIFIWVIGALATVKLLIDFSSVLKPFLLSIVFVSILEAVVQTLECLQWKLVLFVFMVLHKFWLFFRFIGHCLEYALRVAAWVRGKLLNDGTAFPEALSSRVAVKELRSNLKDWRRLFLSWDGLFAGHNPVFRFIAVFLTLVLVALAVFTLNQALVANIQDFLSGPRLHDYEVQFAVLTSRIQRFIETVPDELSFLDNSTRTHLRKEVTDFETALNNSKTDSFTFLGDAIKNILQDVAESSSEYLTEMIFFLLYTLLYLFKPLEINTSTECMDDVAEIYTVFSAFRCEIHLEGEQSQEPLLQRKLAFPYDEFYQTVNNPKVGIHRKLNEIIQTYFKLTIFINALFALAFWMLLNELNADLSILLAVISFILAFIPEIGIIISVILPLPFLALTPDDTASPQNESHMSKTQALLWYLCGSMAIKLVIGNILYTYLMGRNPILSGAATTAVKGIKETHPVVVLVVVVLAGEIWGPVGMFVSVPIISLVRLVFAYWYLDLGCEESAQAAAASASERTVGSPRALFAQYRRMLSITS